MEAGYKNPNGKPNGNLLTRLASFRTKLANERTVLAYMRTALTFIVGGLTFIRFFDNRIIEIVGWVFIPVGIVTLILGIIRYNKTREHISELSD